MNAYDLDWKGLEESVIFYFYLNIWNWFLLILFQRA